MEQAEGIIGANANGGWRFDGTMQGGGGGGEVGEES